MEEKFDDLKGRAKEGAGAAADDKDLEREGKVDRARATMKEKFDEAKDKVDEVADKAKDGLSDKR